MTNWPIISAAVERCAGMAPPLRRIHGAPLKTAVPPSKSQGTRPEKVEFGVPRSTRLPRDDPARLARLSIPITGGSKCGHTNSQAHRQEEQKGDPFVLEGLGWKGPGK